MEIPQVLEDYLNYMETIKGTSPNTVKEYFFDLRTFLRFVKIRFKMVDSEILFDDVDISDIDVDFIKRITIQDLHAYISYVDKSRNKSNSTKSRKVSSIRSFFEYYLKLVF